jgi:putative tryptophan/tyrosine transport system substrate-binding protein
MNRREFVTFIGSAAVAQLVRPPVARAQDAGRTYRLAIMFGGPREAARVVTFFDELKLLGFVEGKNLSIVPGGFDLRSDHYAEYARTLAKSNPDVIYCVGDGATLAAREATQSIPVVGFFTPNIVAAGVVQAFARPGGNVTGVSFPSELDGKRQELLLEAVPGARGIAILADPNYTPPAQLQVLEDAARARGLKAIVLTAGKEAEIVPAMDNAKESGATALNVLSTHLFSANRLVIIERAAALHLPAIYEWPEMAKEGGLIAYGPPLLPMWRQAAHLVAKLFHSAKPQDLPVELPTKYDLIVNLKTAKALGLTIPESLLTRADEVIE